MIDRRGESAHSLCLSKVKILILSSKNILFPFLLVALPQKAWDLKLESLHLLRSFLQGCKRITNPMLGAFEGCEWITNPMLCLGCIAWVRQDLESGCRYANSGHLGVTDTRSGTHCWLLGMQRKWPDSTIHRVDPNYSCAQHAGNQASRACTLQLSCRNT